MEGLMVKMFWCLIPIGILTLLIRAYNALFLNPNRIRSTLSKQGIGGPKPVFFYGNVKEIKEMESAVSPSSSSSSSDGANYISFINDWVHYTFPYLQTWSRHYGPMYMFSTGSKQHLYVSQPELIKELNGYISLDLGKPSYLSKALEPMLGNGVIKANGHSWAHQRKLIAPEFYLHKVKGMAGLMEECTMSMIKTWESRLNERNGGVVELVIDQDFRSLSGDVISRACFGSSYSQGKHIFSKLRAMQEAMSRPSLLFGLANFRFIPTKSNRMIWRLKKEVEASILNVIKGRQEESQVNKQGPYGKDLLDMILESAASDSELHKDRRKMDRFIVDNCKNIYFAGYETTALSASWTLMLLSLYPEWQERVRAEIVDTLGAESLLHNSVDFDALRQLKTLTMVIQESLRLFSPSVLVAREAFADIKLGNFVVPKGTNIWSSVPAMHRDTDNWGPDAYEFNPERFANGVSEACKYPQAYLPFGYGPRLCLGQNFAIQELKITLSLVLSRFSFSLSPEYRHSPAYKMLLMPEHGMRLLMKRV